MYTHTHTKSSGSRSTTSGRGSFVASLGTSASAVRPADDAAPAAAVGVGDAGQRLAFLNGDGSKVKHMLLRFIASALD